MYRVAMNRTVAPVILCFQNSVTSCSKVMRYSYASSASHGKFISSCHHVVFAGAAHLKHRSATSLRACCIAAVACMIRT